MPSKVTPLLAQAGIVMTVSPLCPTITLNLHTFRQVKAMLTSRGKGGKTLVYWAVCSGSKDMFEAVVAAISSDQVCPPLRRDPHVCVLHLKAIPFRPHISYNWVSVWCWIHHLLSTISSVVERESHTLCSSANLVFFPSTFVERVSTRSPIGNKATVGSPRGENMPRHAG